MLTYQSEKLKMPDIKLPNYIAVQQQPVLACHAVYIYILNYIVIADASQSYYPKHTCPDGQVPKVFGVSTSHYLSKCVCPEGQVHDTSTSTCKGNTDMIVQHHVT